MPRGKAAKVGDTNVSANGYHYTRTEAGWKLTHHIIAEKKLGRPLREDERACFVDGDRTNLTERNIEITIKRTATIKKRLAQVESRIQELEAERAYLLKLLEQKSNKSLT